MHHSSMIAGAGEALRTAAVVRVSSMGEYPAAWRAVETQRAFLHYTWTQGV